MVDVRRQRVEAIDHLTERGRCAQRLLRFRRLIYHCVYAICNRAACTRLSPLPGVCLRARWHNNTAVKDIVVSTILTGDVYLLQKFLEFLHKRITVKSTNANKKFTDSDEQIARLELTQSATETDDVWIRFGGE
ncbi:hypothetical protein CBL_11039 [Carabus blaptoides fortunei]